MTTMLNVRTDLTLKKQLDALAENNGISTTALVNIILRNGLRYGVKIVDDNLGLNREYIDTKLCEAEEEMAKPGAKWHDFDETMDELHANFVKNKQNKQCRTN